MATNHATIFLRLRTVRILTELHGSLNLLLIGIKHARRRILTTIMILFWLPFYSVSRTVNQTWYLTFYFFSCSAIY